MKKTLSLMVDNSRIGKQGSALLFTVFLLIQLMLCAMLIHKKYCRSMELVAEHVQKVQQELWLESWAHWSVLMLKNQFNEWHQFLSGQQKNTLTVHIPQHKKISMLADITCAFTASEPDTITIALRALGSSHYYFNYCLRRIEHADKTESFALSRSA